MINAILKALGQLPDPRFHGTILRGIGLTLALFFGLYAVVFFGVGWLVGDGLTLPWIGTLAWADSVASWASLVLMMGLSVFLMIPVASAMTSLFLEDVADAVEDVHYPHLPQVPHTSFADGLSDTLGFLGLMLVANLLALILYLMFIPFAPLIFLALNGFLLGREYFQITAMRRLGRQGAAKLRRKHIVHIWGLGICMALPLTIPVLNLLVPVIGAAAFTHLYHQIAAQSD